LGTAECFTPSHTTALYNKTQDMRKPFHTFLSAHTNLKNNVFYSGTLNALIKDMLLQNVKDLFEKKTDEDFSANKKIYSISAECLDTLSDISKHEKNRAPVLFNLLKSVESWQLNLGVPVRKEEAPELKKVLEDLKRQPTEETRKKFFQRLSEIPRQDERITQLMPLMTVAIRSNRKFSFYFDTFSDTDLFLTLKFEVEGARHD
jgi:hypothetical protein